MKAAGNKPSAWAATGVQMKTSQALPNAKEPAAAVVPAAAQEKRTPVDTRGFDLHPPVVLMKGTHEPAFLISWRSPREAFKCFDWKSRLMIWGGPALALACMYLLLGARLR
jgi:hypothetical protein